VNIIAGASRGVGRATAVRLARDFAADVGLARDGWPEDVADAVAFLFVRWIKGSALRV
jgi:NAD(P)-dependent dehydrogenase (short-subunit alcohol dehydrogenase family)